MENKISRYRKVKTFVQKILGIDRKIKKDYWTTRKNLNYYKEVIKLAKKYSPNAKSVIDVGSHNSEFLTQFDWIPNKTAIDIMRTPSIPGADNIMGDFMKYEPKHPFDLVLCLQVLEHLESPGVFVQKLLETGKIAIISVPYKWPEGKCRFHVQDPVDEEKFLNWTKKPWIEQVIVDDGLKRLIAVVGD